MNEKSDSLFVDELGSLLLRADGGSAWLQVIGMYPVNAPMLCSGTIDVGIYIGPLTAMQHGWGGRHER